MSSTRISMTISTRTAIGTLGCLLAIGAAHADGLDPVKGAFGEIKPIIDTRLRMEEVDQDPLAEDASALTLRARLGFETFSRSPSGSIPGRWLPRMRVALA